MSRFDLKPLTAELIAELGLETDLLWQVKLNDEVFGPFETLSLKHYARENSDIIQSCEVSPWEKEEWQLFFDTPEFSQQESEHPGDIQEQFWLLENGQKSGPWSQEEIQEKIKTQVLGPHHEVSEDQGHVWKKLLHSPRFRGNFAKNHSLPSAPHESTFQEGKVRVLQELERKQKEIPVTEAIPDLAYVIRMQESTPKIKLEEVKLNTQNDVPVTRSFRWAAPAAASAVIVFVMAGLLVGQEKNQDPLGTAVEETPRSARTARTQRVPAVVPKREPSPPRGMASVPRYDQRSELTQQPDYRTNYTTEVEVHQADDFGGEYGVDLRERESADTYAESAHEVPDDIPSLVDQAYPEEQSLDDAMGSVSQAPPQNDPIVIDQPMENDYAPNNSDINDRPEEF